LNYHRVDGSGTLLFHEIEKAHDRVLIFNRLSYEVQIDVARLHLEREIEAQNRHGHLVSGWDNEALKAICAQRLQRKTGRTPDA
jgi:hypothetical protein